MDLIKFLRYGWPIDACKVAINSTKLCNQEGVRKNRSQVHQYLQHELSRGTIIWPFQDNPFGASARFLPLDAIPKCDSEDLRIILNLSYPFEDGSMNQAIDKDFFLGEQVCLRYPTVEDLVKLIIKKGRGCLLFKWNLRKCYHQIFMDPGFIHLLGFTVDGFIFFDVVLSMGLCIACYICQHITNSLIFIYKRLSFEGIKYLDDLGGLSTEPELVKPLIPWEVC